MASSVGRDDLGRQALEVLRSRDVDVACVDRSERPTGTVHVQLDGEGKASYTFGMDTAWDRIEWSENLAGLARIAEAVCFGTLGQRSESSRQTIRRFLDEVPETCWRVFDVNLRPPFYENATILDSLERADVLKLNDDELPIVASLCGLHGSETDLLRQLAERYSYRAVALTRGADGAYLLRGHQISSHPGYPAEIVDTVGAGDAFTATLTMGLLEDQDLDRINQRACRVAAFVCSQSGATPLLTGEL
jgi:fructokinase